MSKPRVSELIAQWEHTPYKDNPAGKSASMQPLPSVQAMFGSSTTSKKPKAEPSAPPLDTLPQPTFSAPRVTPSKTAKTVSAAPSSSNRKPWVTATNATPVKTSSRLNFLSSSATSKPNSTIRDAAGAADLVRRLKEAPSSAPARGFSDQQFVSPKQYKTKTYENYMSADIAKARKSLTRGTGEASSPTRKNKPRSEVYPLVAKDKPNPEFSVSAIPLAESFDIPSIADANYAEEEGDENSHGQLNRVRRESAKTTPNTLNRARGESSKQDRPVPIPEESSRVMDESEVIKADMSEGAPAAKEMRRKKKRPENGDESATSDAAAARYNIVVPRSKRKCRDVICFFALVITWIGMITVGIIAIKVGKVEALLHATDYKGRICGSCNFDENDQATCGKPFQVVDPNRMDEVFAVCTSHCPRANETICPSDIDVDEKDNCWRSYVDQKALFYRCVPLAQEDRRCLSSPFLEFANESLPESADDPRCGTCLEPLFESESERPKDPSSLDCRAKKVEYTTNRKFERLHPAVELFASWGEILIHWLADLQASWRPIAVGGGCGALVGSMIWILLFACFSGMVVWMTLFSVVLGCGFVAFELLYAGGVVSQTQVTDALKQLEFIEDPEALASVQIFMVSDSAQVESYAIAGWIMTIVTLILLLLACSLQRSVVRAAAIMRGASRAVLFNCSLWLMPFLSFGLVIGIFAWWVFATALLGSAGRIAPASFVLSLTGTNLTSYVGNETTRPNDWVDVNPALIVFHTFGCLWTIFFIRAISSMTISAVVASWRYKERRRLSVCGALGMILRFHLGTAALGSAVIAMLQLLRMILSYIDRQARRVSVGKQNVFSRAVLAVATCILSCFSSFLKFATRFSYVVAAVRGESFCLATKSAFVLLSSNLIDSGVSLFLSGAVLLLGRLLVVGLSASLAWFLVWYGIFPVENLSSYLVPVMSSTVLAWFISGACFDLYAASLDTLIICKMEQKAKSIKRSELNNNNQEAVSMV